MQLVHDTIHHDDGSTSIAEPRFVADPATLFPEIERINTYPEYFRHRQFSDFSVAIYGIEYGKVADEALGICKNYARNFPAILEEYEGHGLYLWSKTRGSGKTYLSTILGAELSHYPKHIRWYSMPNLLQEIKDGYDRESGISSSEVIRIAKHTDVLLLDDIGVEKQSAWVNETVFSILDYRMIHCLPTIFTSNLDPDDLAYDERIKDRIKRMAEIIHMPEFSVRRHLSRRDKFGIFLRGGNANVQPQTNPANPGRAQGV